MSTVPSKSNKNGQKTKLIILAVVFCVLIAASVAVAVIVSLGGDDSGKSEPTASNTQSSVSDSTGSDQTESNGDGSGNVSSIVLNSSYQVPTPDADAYFNQISSIVSKTDAFTSPNVRTESQVYSDFYNRGLTITPVTTEYMMNGDLDEKKNISRYSSLTHPVYQTYYTTANNDLWLIVEINGAIMATPISYNATLESGYHIMLSETDTMTSYDSTSNQFYTVKPNSSEIDLRVVGTINAETLENYKLGGN